MFQATGSAPKRIKNLSHLVCRFQRSTRLPDSPCERNVGKEDVDTVRRSLVVLATTAVAVYFVPKIITSAHAAGTQPRHQRAASNDASDLLTQAFQSQPTRSGHYGDGVTDTTGPVQAVLDHLTKAGGGSLYFPRGDYPLNIKIAGSNIQIACETGTVLRPANSKPVIDILNGAKVIPPKNNAT